MAFTVKNVDWGKEKHRLSKLRERVFVYEWHIPSRYEFDHHDPLAHHVLVTDENDQEVATGRLTADGQLGRIAVLRQHRRPKMYRRVFKALLEIAKQQDMADVELQCDLAAVEYYQQQGFRPVGTVYMDAGVARQRMRCNIETFSLKRLDHAH